MGLRYAAYAIAHYLALWLDQNNHLLGWWNLPDQYGERLKLALEDLGPIFVKLGQLLADTDLLSDQVAGPLAQLCDAVKPVPAPIAVYHLEQIYGQALSDLFAEYESEPLAAASIAQVHGARLQNGDKVVIKMQRPGIGYQVKRDLAVMQLCAYLLACLPRLNQRLRPKEIVKEFRLILQGSLILHARLQICPL